MRRTSVLATPALAATLGLTLALPASAGTPPFQGCAQGYAKVTVTSSSLASKDANGNGFVCQNLESGGKRTTAEARRQVPRRRLRVQPATGYQDPRFQVCTY